MLPDQLWWFRPGRGPSSRAKVPLDRQGRAQCASISVSSYANYWLQGNMVSTQVCWASRFLVTAAGNCAEVASTALASREKSLNGGHRRCLCRSVTETITNNATLFCKAERVTGPLGEADEIKAGFRGLISTLLTEAESPTWPRHFSTQSSQFTLFYMIQHPACSG